MLKATGIVRKVDELGRLVIPMELRKRYGIEEGTPMEIYTDENGKIMVQKYSVCCSECGSVDVALSLNSINLCPACLSKIRVMVEAK